VVLAFAAALVTPGPWTGATSVSHGSRARVTFEVVPGSGTIQPFVRVDLRGCRSTRTVHIRSHLGLVAAASGRFSWTTHAVAGLADDGAAVVDDPELDDPDAVIDGEPIEDGDYDEDDAPIDDDTGEEP
jgi:hypothetical protein